MDTETPETPVQPERPKSSSGRWLIIALAIIFIAVSIRMVLMATDAVNHKIGRDPVLALAQEDKAYSSIDLEQVHSGGVGRDGVPALSDPHCVTGEAVEAINEEMHGKFLVSGDRVIGIEINGKHRAYPLSILTHHMVVNDDVGGTPVLVTYDPWCDSAAVFSREVGGEVLEFGVSGEIYNSNMLMYNKATATQDESLWSQLLMRAVIGRAAESRATLTALSCTLTHWGEWQEAHPATDVLSLETGYYPDYGSNPFGSYYDAGKPSYAVDKPEGGPVLPDMARIAAVQVDGEWVTFVYDTRDDVSSGGGPVEWSSDGLSFVRSPHSKAMDPPTITIRGADGQPLPVVYSFWFSWHALYPDEAAPRQATGP